MNIDQNGNPTDGRGDWKQFLCRACGWIYDEKLGDPDGGLSAGTRFDDIPDDWQCPLCGVTKRDFEPFIPRNINIIKPQVNPTGDTGGLIVIGAGMIGSELAEDIVKAGHRVTLIDRNALPLAEVLPTKASQMVKNALEQSDITFLGEHTVSHIEKTDETYTIHFADQQPSVTAEEVVASTGLMVDGRLPQRAGVEFVPQQGIIVDSDTLHTSQADVYAIGDCMAIGGQACRFVAPLRQQADTIAHQVLNLDGESYQHQAPVIRLKTKSVAVTVTGNPCKQTEWQTLVDDGNTLIMQQPKEAGNGRVEIVINNGFSL